MKDRLNFQSIFEAAPGLYLILAPDFTIIGVSDNYLKATMTRRNEIIGKGLFEVFPDNPDDPTADGVSNLRASLNHVLTKKEQHIMAIQKYDIRRTDGTFEERYWSPLNKPVLNDKNEVECIIHCVEDVSRRQRAEAGIIKINKTLLEQSEQLNLINQELEAFSYSVSHDLKAPLRALQGFSKALYENYHHSFNGESLRWLEFIESNASRMGVLIDDVLNFSRVGRANLQITDVNMKFLTSDVFEMEKLQYKNQKINFKLGRIPNAMGDATMLKLVWQNLISNALKYSSKKEEISIRINGKKENGFHIYSVKDNGVGFDQKYKEKLFGVFQRLHSNEEFEGTGVGLAIVNKIIYKHNGWIKAIGEPGRGAEFSFAIPIR